MHKKLSFILSVCFGFVAVSCERNEKNLYDDYQSGVLYKSHPRVYLWAFSDGMIELKNDRETKGGLKWSDLRSHGFLSKNISMFVAPGPRKDQVILGLMLTPEVGALQEVELVDLDGRSAVINIPNEVASDLVSVTRHVAGGWISPDDMNYPEDQRRASLLAFWSAVEGIEWGPLEKRYREWEKKPAFESLKM